MAKKKSTRRKKQPAKPKPPEEAASFRELADAVGRQPSTVHGWSRRPDWPFGYRPVRWPLSIEKVREWMETVLQRGDGANSELDPLKGARTEKVQLEAERLRHQLQIITGAYVDRAVARAEIASIIHNTKTAILSECQSVAEAAASLGLVEDGEKSELHRLLRSHFEALLRRFAQSMNDVVDRTS